MSKIYFPQLGGWGLFCHQNQSCSKLPEMDRSGVKKIFPHPRGGGGFSAKSQQIRGSMMREILVCEVTSCATTRAEYLSKRQKIRGGFSADLNQPEV